MKSFPGCAIVMHTLAATVAFIGLFDFVLDGIKRDRLPWVDNMILSAAVESYAFGDPELLRRTLTVMGRTAGTSDINGIVDYNFLWVIGHDALQRYFADTAYLRRS